jgi:hypothetical protein
MWLVPFYAPEDGFEEEQLSRMQRRQEGTWQGEPDLSMLVETKSPIGSASGLLSCDGRSGTIGHKVVRS